MHLIIHSIKRHLWLFLIILSLFNGLNLYSLNAQDSTQINEHRNTQGVWFGAYTKYHLNEKWAYYGEYHFRRRNGLSDMGQIYLRFGITKHQSERLDLTLGFVNPYYWAPNQDDPMLDKVVPQFRLWEQAIYKTPINHIKLLHQIRVEQRYKRAYLKGSDFKLTHRFRYKFTFYVPLNHRKFKEKTLFLGAYNEFFIQTGKSITYEYMEDNRAYLGLGYKFTENFQIQAGYMNTFRFDGDPWKYEHRHIFRLNLYHHIVIKTDEEKRFWHIPRMAF